MAKITMKNVFSGIKTAVAIVAHPDDETLWAGGTILTHPEIKWTVLTLCRKSDPDRAPKFFKVVEDLKAKGVMADLDDDLDQKPLEQTEIKAVILNTIAERNFDIILTHSPKGEYTRHLRHEEISQAVLALWTEGKLKAERLLLSAYEDGGGKYLPRPIESADIVIKLAKNVWQRKKDIIISGYGFSPGSFEAKAVSKIEAFWLINKPDDTEKIFKQELKK
jgi:LmbE family N-acetylglucosaminyl deacetylase